MKAKSTGGNPAEVVGHGVVRDEKRLVGRAEVVGEAAPVGMRRYLDLLLDGNRRNTRHAADEVDGEDPGVVRRPPREVGRHVSRPGADLQHPARPGAEPPGELAAVDRHNASRT
jgi:hypothetical protein